MKIILAENAGFCYGVKLACQTAFNATKQYHEGVKSLGPIIHNPQMVNKLTEAGLEVVDAVSDVEQGAVLIRSHGAAPGVYQEIERRGLSLVDATCPLVRRAQSFVRSLSEDGYEVVVIGEPDHPEVKALLAYATHGATVVESLDDIDKIKPHKKIGVVAQTTQLQEDYQQLVARLLPLAKELKVFNTICDATAKRQDSLRQLAEKVDGIVVVGGKNSANTTRLAQHGKNFGKPTWHIETAKELQADWFEGMEVVGVTAGASTPDWLIDEVIARLEEF